ncbi:MAG: protein translocase subunit SecD [Acidimicrobiales bacterium]
MKDRRPLWISLLAVVGVAVVALVATVSSGWSPKLGLDLAGGLSVVYRTQRPVSQAELDTVITILGERVNAGTSGATVQSQGKDQIAVAVPGVKNSQKLLQTLGQTAELLFRPVECYAPAYTVKKGQAPLTGPLPTCGPAYQATAANVQMNSNGGIGNSSFGPDPQFARYASTSPNNDNKNATVLLPGSGSACFGGRCVLGPAGVTGNQVKSASAQLLTNGQWAVNLSLNGAGATAWDNLARQQFHAFVGIDLDGQVISAPGTLPGQQSFTSFAGQVQITGNFTANSAKTLATQLNYGALPVKLDQQTVQSVSPTLGRSSLQAGLISGLAGLALVLLYVIFYYRLLGLVVVAGLAVTGALLWSIIAIMGQSGITIDLAGVIGVIVSVGITVDSYIVYFERLKDEARSGRTVRTSVDRGFASAFRTVLAADAVSLLGAVILYYNSIGPVQGFALFLGISTLLDVFVTYFFTRPFVILLGRTRSGSEVRGMSVASGLGVTAGARP